ncbi:MAG: hypothetical protein LBK60_00695 [Verrucomicrobiales bacterium]|jgi:alpha-mannosidase|nr:hypothetical protein [Verrucomicrobiales bacterium]
MDALTFHLIANAHLDPVWLWDWREGLNQGLNTCRTVLDLMDENPALTFNRGEAAVYQHIERADRDTFARIKQHIASGRWDVVGGTWVQADQNMPATETLTRQFTRGQNYFLSRFGKKSAVAWSADCFGHAAGMPEIFAAAGIRYFAFTRPGPATLPLAKPAFWWRGAGGARILAYRPTGDWYGCERWDIPALLDTTRQRGAGHGLQNVAVFYGLGDHGGGPTRRHLADLAAWSAAHPEIRVVHSTMHKFFHALENEMHGQRRDFLPEVRGELNFVARGCFSSMLKLKTAYRRAERLVSRAETLQTAVAVQTGAAGEHLAAAWDSVLFNSFHDILPGTAIERALDEQIGELGGAAHTARAAELAALNALAARVDTRVLPAAGGDLPAGVALLAWNPRPRPFDGLVELEACVDDRPLLAYREDRGGDLPVRLLDARKRPLPCQKIETENRFWVEGQWRVRVVAPVKLPPLGWTVLELGHDQNPPSLSAPSRPATASAKNGVHKIANGIFTVSARAGAAGIEIKRAGKKFLAGAGLGAALFDDPWDTWGSGAKNIEREGAETLRERWTVERAQILEAGPWRAALWARLTGKNSALELTLRLAAGRDAVDVAARVHFAGRAARLRLLFPLVTGSGGVAEFDVPGARLVRQPRGEVPALRWMRLAGGALGFASDALYSYHVNEKIFRPTVARATRYADSRPRAADDEPWAPATDLGEARFNFLIAPGDGNLPRLAEELDRPPAVQLVPAKPGPLPSQGSVAALWPDHLELLAFKPADDGRGLVLRVRETAGKTTRPRLTLLGKIYHLPVVGKYQIASFRLFKNGRDFSIKPCDAVENST